MKLTLIQTIELIKDLRTEASNILERHPYDPLDHARHDAERLREKADKFEQALHKAIGWTGLEVGYDESGEISL